MKIAMLGHKRIPSREGGIEIVVEELSYRMVEKGQEVYALNRSSKDYKAVKRYRNIRLIKIPTIQTKQLDAFVYSFLASIYVTCHKYDILHYHALGPTVMSVIPKLFGKRVVVTVHGLDWQRAKWSKFATWYLKLGEKIAAKHADEIIVLSKNIQQYFMDKYNRKTRFIPNGMNPPVIQEADLITKEYGLTKDGYLLFLARIVPEKGLHILLRAFKKIKTDIKLVIAGGSSFVSDYYKSIKEMAAKDDRVIMTGFVEGQMLEELYSNSLLYILPSEIEGMPISLLEAMGYGNYCVVSDIPENTEVLADYGTSFKCGSANALAHTLTDLLVDTDKIKKDRAGISDYILGKYNWDKVIDQTLKVYRGDSSNL